MSRVVLLLVLLIASTTCTACTAEDPPVNPVAAEAASAQPEIAPNAPTERKSAVRIVTTGGTCSATKIEPRILLSASHCFRTATRMIAVDGEAGLIQRVLQDGNDHALVLLDGIELKDFAKLGPPPKEGDNIHYWGNPFIFSMLLRRGYVSGFFGHNTIYDVNGFHGDSGAGVFDDKNRLVAVISYIHNYQSFAVMGSYPLNFTAEQLKSIGMEPNKLFMSGIKAEVKLTYSD